MSAKSAVEKENKSGLQPRSRPVNQLREHPGDKAPAFIASRRRGRDASGDLSGRCYDSLARARQRARASVAYLPLSLFAASLGRASARAIVGGALSHAFQPRCSVRRALSREAGCSFHPTLAMCLRNSSTAIRGRVRPLRRLSDRSADSGRRFDLGPFGRRLELRTKCLSVEFAAHTARHLRRRLAR